MTEKEKTLIADLLVKGMKKEMSEELKTIKEETIKEIEKKVRLDLEAGVKIPKITVIKGEKKLIHKDFKKLAVLMQLKIPILLVGEPGTGKTLTVKMIADQMQLPFHSISVGYQTTKSDILGFMDATGRYNSTGFRKAFEEGGIFLMDEIDAGNPNVLIQINSAISNGFLEFPDKMVFAHENFTFIGTANTYGTGGDMKFVGRNQLDAATLDRFIVFDWKLDKELEKTLTGNDEWLATVNKVRALISRKKYDLIMSQRVSINGAKLLKAGVPREAVIEMLILKGLSKDIKELIKKEIDA